VKRGKGEWNESSKEGRTVSRMVLCDPIFSPHEPVNRTNDERLSK